MPIIALHFLYSAYRISFHAHKSFFAPFACPAHVLSTIRNDLLFIKDTFLALYALVAHQALHLNYISSTLRHSPSKSTIVHFFHFLSLHVRFQTFPAMIFAVWHHLPFLAPYMHFVDHAL